MAKTTKNKTNYVAKTTTNIFAKTKIYGITRIMYFSAMQLPSNLHDSPKKAFNFIVQINTITLNNIYSVIGIIHVHFRHNAKKD